MRRVLFILGQLTDEDTLWLANNGEKLSYNNGSYLISAGEHSDFLFIILDGIAEVKTASGKWLAKVQSGDILGEMSFIDSAFPSASVVAETNCNVLRIDKTAIAAKLEGDIGFSSRFYKAIAMFLADRLRNTIQSMGFGEDQMHVDAEEGELDESVLDTVHLAGIRFEKILQALNN